MPASKETSSTYGELIRGVGVGGKKKKKMKVSTNPSMKKKKVGYKTYG